MEEIKTLRKFKKVMEVKAEEDFENICQIAPKFESLLNIDFIKEAMLTSWVYGLHEGLRQARIKYDNRKKKNK